VKLSLRQILIDSYISAIAIAVLLFSSLVDTLWDYGSRFFLSSLSWLLLLRFGVCLTFHSEPTDISYSPHPHTLLML
jgi:hypothetical protein